MPNAPPRKPSLSSGTRHGTGIPAGGATSHGSSKGFTRNPNPRAPPLQGKISAVSTPVSRDRTAMRKDQAEALMDRLWLLAYTADNHATQVQAADKLLDRLEGKAIARTISMDPFADLTHEQVDVLLAAAERSNSIGADSPLALGEAEAPVGKPD